MNHYLNLHLHPEGFKNVKYALRVKTAGLAAQVSQETRVLCRPQIVTELNRALTENILVRRRAERGNDERSQARRNPLSQRVFVDLVAPVLIVFLGVCVSQRRVGSTNPAFINPSWLRIA